MVKPKATPRTVKSVISGVPIEYRGYGRPPKYTPAEAKDRQRERARGYAKARASELATLRAAMTVTAHATV